MTEPTQELIARAEAFWNTRGARNPWPTMYHAMAAFAVSEREECAQIAEHLNGWGVPHHPELAHHIAKCIRAK